MPLDCDGAPVYYRSCMFIQGNDPPQRRVIELSSEQGGEFLFHLFLDALAGANDGARLEEFEHAE
jgi:hypothetical protein